MRKHERYQNSNKPIGRAFKKHWQYTDRETYKKMISTMQSTFHIFKPDGSILLLLRRQVKYGIRVKLRKSGKPGVHLQAEEEHLSMRPDLIAMIEAGKVVLL